MNSKCYASHQPFTVLLICLFSGWNRVWIRDSNVTPMPCRGVLREAGPTISAARTTPTSWVRISGEHSNSETVTVDPASLQMPLHGMGETSESRRSSIMKGKQTSAVWTFSAEDSTLTFRVLRHTRIFPFLSLISAAERTRSSQEVVSWTRHTTVDTQIQLRHHPTTLPYLSVLNKCRQQC